MRTRNIMLIGESGVGKSSIVNMISGTQLAKTSSNIFDHHQWASKAACYVTILPDSGMKLNLWDTAGLDDEAGAASTGKLRNLGMLLHHLALFHKIDLLLFCMRAGRVKNIFVKSYNAIYGKNCKRKVPVALIVTGLERHGGNMHAWWAKNRDGIFNHGLIFDAHACVTSLPSHDDPRIQEQIDISRCRLRNLVQLSDDVGLPHELICPGTENAGGRLICPEDITQDDIVIMLMGPTGSGKNSFITKAGDVSEDVVGVEDTGTLDMRPFKYTDPSSSSNIVLVDTPSLGHSNVPSDSKVILSIAAWVREMYEANILVTGILYFYPISDNRVTRTPQKDLRLFQEIYGDQVHLSTVLVTAMWDEAEESQSEAAVEKLAPGQWQNMIPRDAKVTHFLNTRESALSTIAHILEGRKATTSLSSDHFRVRTVVVIGSVGVGKSSIINVIAGEKLAATSADAMACTKEFEFYMVDVEPGINMEIWDTVGLDRTADTKDGLMKFLRHLLIVHGIDLLLLCIRGSALKAQLDKFKEVSDLAKEKLVPVALVITGLETEYDMDSWWSQNKDRLSLRELTVDVHVCVTTLPSVENSRVQDKINISQRILRELVKRPVPITSRTEDVQPKFPSTESTLKIKPRPSSRSISFYELTAEDAIIVLLGAAGCGKDSFVRELTGLEAKVKGSIRSQACRLKTFKFQDRHSGLSFVLLNTPDFDDANTDLSDAKILAQLSAWLHETYKRGIIVAGVLYFHPTLQSLIPWHLRPFLHIYGASVFSRLAVINAVWDDDDSVDPHSHQGSGASQEVQGLIGEGTTDQSDTALRHVSTDDSARAICREVAEGLGLIQATHLKQVVSDLGKELQSLVNTSDVPRTNPCPFSRIEALADRHLEVLDQIRRHHGEDPQVIKKLQRERQDIQHQMAEVLAQMKAIQSPLLRRIIHCVDLCR